MGVYQRKDGRPSVWAVTMVRDEADVLLHTLRHMASEGVDGIIIADNLSTDATPAIIQQFHDECMPAGDPLEWGPPWVSMLEDHDPAYYQSRKMTNLAQLAHDLYEADWIIPFDADELWCARSQPLADLLRGLPAYIDRVDATLFNHFPTSSDVDDANPLTRIVQRDPQRAPLPKVALRWKPDMVIHQGNHGADGWHATQKTTMKVHHFPWRSFEQFLRKVRNGAAAYAATDLPEDMGSHWRGYGRVLEEGGEQALHDEVWCRWFFDPNMRLRHDPAPYRKWATS